MKKKLTFLFYLIGPLLLFGCFTKIIGLLITSVVLLIVYIALCLVSIFIVDIDDMDTDAKIPSHVKRLFLKKVNYEGGSYYIYKDNSYDAITLLDWDGFFLRKVKRYIGFSSFLGSAKNDISKYIRENKSVDTYYGFDGFLSNEDRIAHTRDKKLKKLLKK